MTRVRSGLLFFTLGLAPASMVFVACSSSEVPSPTTTSNDGGVSEAGEDSRPTDSATSPDAAPGDAAVPSFRVGGQVTGLGADVDAGDAGPALVLRNNGGDDLPIAKSGAFTFAKDVKSGAPYAVTVASQPTGQTCAVTSGTGTVAKADVTNVAVACGRTPYTITANVKTLTHAGLVIQQNGGSDLTVNATSKVIFPGKLFYGDAYSVTVKTQPSGRPRQTCAPFNGDGVVTGDVEVDVVCLDAFLGATELDADKTFTTSTSFAAVGLAWNGTAMFQAGSSTAGEGLSRYDAALAFVSSAGFAPGRDVRSLFTVGTQLYTRRAGTADIEKVSTDGAVTAGVTVTPAPTCADCPVVYDAAGAQLLANDSGALQRWKLADGTALPTTTLTGFGSEPREGDNYYNQWIASAGGYVLTAVDGRLSIWNVTSGMRVKILTLNGAASGTTLGISFAYANDHVWVRDAFSGTAIWRGYDIGL